jgi:hypothetical protein
MLVLRKWLSSWEVWGDSTAAIELGVDKDMGL